MTVIDFIVQSLYHNRRERRWLVQCGELDRFVWAATEDDAFRLAVEEDMDEANDDEGPSGLALIASVVEVMPDSDLSYLSVETQLKKMGRWMEPAANPSEGANAQ